MKVKTLKNLLQVNNDMFRSILNKLDVDADKMRKKI